ncbi:acyl-CoA thioesterase [Seonamhaeicola maritimus]|uniref:Acyl-CoA thioesterase n=1 Tax=Seonamhaeicola maritimus TaxID=2591822 RepID=A0A5C7GMW4_9FLAO|nr:acyl-CoA thioesterase [Seonamhaeicola maritimus]TXG39645.1 acyl-CoA thioesterase [Seonamhaeicola maritimus]
MIYYWLHIVFVFFGSKFFWKRVNLDENFSRTRRVSILDCDAFRFMANSKYFYYMDLIRLEITFRTDLYKNTIKKRKYPVIGSQKIIYKKPLKRWTKFKITLILEGWDDNWVYHRQVFSRNNEVYAIGFTKVGFWYKHKIQEIRPIIFESGIKLKEKPVSSEVLKMFDNDYNILKTTEK